MNPDALKHCPICTQDLPVTEFGRNAYYDTRGAKDGRNIYCRSCIRTKRTATRKALKEYKETRKRYVALQIEMGEWDAGSVASHANNLELIKLAPVDRVRLAIERGARTQREIGLETKLGKDEIGDALATLLLWTNEITTKLVGNTRLYFIKQAPVEPVTPIVRSRSSSLVDIARKHCGPVVRGTKEIRRIA